MVDDSSPAAPFTTRAGAFLIHILTASGAALALVALMLAGLSEWPAMFFVLGVALVVDGIDGPLARRFRVKELLPRWSGDSLDFVVDFVTYVFVPAFAIAASGLMPPVFAIASGVLIVITGALYFADKNMKLDGNYFRGFPALWNAAAFYLFLLQPPPWIALAGVVALAALTFAAIRFIHPLRVMHWRPFNIALLVVWALLAAYAVWQDLEPGPIVTLPLCIIGFYFVLAGWLHRTL
jgi:phosphatidylcholine synthase